MTKSCVEIRAKCKVANLSLSGTSVTAGRYAAVKQTKTIPNAAFLTRR